MLIALRRRLLGCGERAESGKCRNIPVVTDAVERRNAVSREFQPGGISVACRLSAHVDHFRIGDIGSWLLYSTPLTEDSPVIKASGTDLGTWKFSIEDATLDRLVGPRCGSINGSLDRQQAVADYVPFDRGQNHNGDLATRKILLGRHGLVSGEEDFEAVVPGSSQKLAVFQSRPALVPYSEYFVTPEMVPQPVRKVLVEEDFHETGCLRIA